MTTVAFKDGIMAGDSCWSYKSAVDTLNKKIVRLRSGALLGQSGQNDAREIEEVFQGVKTVKQLPKYADLMKVRSEYLGLLVLPDRTIWKISTTIRAPEHWSADDDDLGLWQIERSFAAIGSGADFAIGAMEAGASARQAVRIACRHDINSRPPVHTLSFPRK